MRQRVWRCAVATACFVVLAAPPAYAAPTRWQSVSVALHGLGSGATPVLIVSGTLPADTPLPADVTLPVPADCGELWVWQVGGGDPITDRMLPFSRSALPECDALELTLEEARSVQAEMAPPLGWISTTPAGTTVALRWQALGAADRVYLSFEVAPQLHAERLRPSHVGIQSTAQATLYTLVAEDVEPGDVLTLSATLVPGVDPAALALSTAAAVAAPPIAHEPHSTTPLVLSVLAVGLAALLVTGVFAVRSREVEQDET